MGGVAGREPRPPARQRRSGRRVDGLPPHARDLDGQGVVDPAPGELLGADQPRQVAEPGGHAARAQAPAVDPRPSAPAEDQRPAVGRLLGHVPEVVLPPGRLVDHGHVRVVVVAAGREPAGGHRAARNRDPHVLDLASSPRLGAMQPVDGIAELRVVGRAAAAVGIPGDQRADPTAVQQAADDRVRVGQPGRAAGDRLVEGAGVRVGPPARRWPMADPVGAEPVVAAAAGVVARREAGTWRRGRGHRGQSQRSRPDPGTACHADSQHDRFLHRVSGGPRPALSGPLPTRCLDTAPAPASVGDLAGRLSEPGWVGQRGRHQVRCSTLGALRLYTDRR